MQLTAVGVRSGSSDKSITLGTWKAGFNNNISFVDPQLMNNYTADIVYRIATLVVNIRRVFIRDFFFFSLYF